MSGFYVYALVDPRSGEPFYVGKGKGPRRHHHEREARGPRTSAKCARIREIWAAGLEVGHETVADGLAEVDALRMERETIARQCLRLLHQAGVGEINWDGEVIELRVPA